jgi:hypothetical protein
MIEEAFQLESEIQEELNESTGKSEKNYYIKGIFSTPETKNRNGRIYPMSIWINEVANFQKEIKNKSINSLGEFEHPARVNVDPMQAVMRITEVKIENGLVLGRAKILNNNSERTNQLKALIDEGVKIGVSSRGVGKVGKNNIVEEFKLTTWDIVTQPSDYNANLSGLVESLNESVGAKEYSINENGSIEEVQVCTKDACHLFEAKDIQKATLEKFQKLLEEISAQSGLEKFSSKKVDATFTDEKGKTQKKSFDTEKDARAYAELMHWKFEYSDGSGGGGAFDKTK